jgi:hypothetical protein
MIQRTFDFLFVASLVVPAAAVIVGMLLLAVGPLLRHRIAARQVQTAHA